jgi:hypothetical protein
MMPERDQPFGRHRWDPPAGFEALATKDLTSATGGDERPAAPQPESPDANG